MLTNGTTDGVTLEEEEQIRRLLPERLKRFVLEFINEPIPWRWLWNAYLTRGEDDLMKLLEVANVKMHANAMGEDFYRYVSPYRDLERPATSRF
ncbi:hypothetical protein FHV99_004647 [Ochrobactrum sp. P20RRXII]|nr:hypothetical protein [Ochrobactrum sp. P20RRXII]